MLCYLLVRGLAGLLASTATCVKCINSEVGAAVVGYIPSIWPAFFVTLCHPLCFLPFPFIALQSIMVRWSTRTTSPRQWRHSPKTGAPEPALGPIIKSLDLDSIDALKESHSLPRAVIEGTTLVASYNWLDKGSEKAILVPGKSQQILYQNKLLTLLI